MESYPSRDHCSVTVRSLGRQQMRPYARGSAGRRLLDKRHTDRLEVEFDIKERIAQRD